MTQNPYQQVPGYVYPGGQPDPAYQPQAPQQYQPPAPPQGPPGGWGQPQQGPPPQNYSQPQAAPPAGGDGFGMPDQRPAAGDQPGIHQLASSGRLVLIRPTRWNVGGTKYGTKEPEEQMIVDMIVCDGEPINGHVDFASRVETPFAVGPKRAPFFLADVIVNKAILDRLRRTLTDPTTPDTVLGRLSSNPPKGGSGFPWWNLEEPTEQDKAVARPIFAAWDQIKAAAAVAPVQQPATPQGPPPGYGQAPPQYAPQPQGPPPGYGQPQQPPPGGYPGYPAQNPYGAPPAQAPYPPY